MIVDRTLRVGLILLVTILCFCCLALVAGAEETPLLHEVRIRYEIDRDDVPAWVTSPETTLVVTVGPALDVVALDGDDPVACTYDGVQAVVTTDSSAVELIVTGPEWSLDDIGQATLAPLRDNKVWALSLTLDDGYTSQATTAKALLDRYEYDASIAVVGSYIGRNVNGHDFANPDQLRAVVADGWHLANHTDQHHRASDIGGDWEIYSDISDANDKIMAAAPGYTPTMFTSPFADPAFTPVIEAHAEQLGFHLVQTLGWEGRQVDFGVFHADDILPYTIGRRQLVHDGSQFAEIHDRTVRQPGTHWWFSLHTHEVSPACDCVETATDVLHRVYGEGGSGEVWVAPAPQVLAYLVARDATTVHEVSREQVGEMPPGFSVSAILEPAPQPEWHTSVLQQGRESYAGTRDATIDGLHPMDNYGSGMSLHVRTQDHTSSVISFDASPVPQDARIGRAVLNLYGSAETNEAVICLDASPLLRPWDEAAVTWYQAGQDDAWGSPGAGAGGIDRTVEHTGLRGLVQGINHWYEVDVTDAVRGWVGDPASNHGLLLTGSGDAAKDVTMYSSEWLNLAYRPQLVVTYTLPITEAIVTPPAGDVMLVGRVLLEGHDSVPSASWSVPLTVTLVRPDGVNAYLLPLTTGEKGEFIVEELAPGFYDLMVEGLHSLPVVREGLTLTSGLNIVTIGPLVEGDVVRDGLISARDRAELKRAMGTARGELGYTGAADLNNDGLVDDRDESLLTANYGRFGKVIQWADPGDPGGPKQAEASLSLSPTAGDISMGRSLAIEVSLDTGGHAVNGVDFWLSFDPTYLGLASAMPTGALTDTLPGTVLDGGEGRIRYLAANLSAPVSGTLPLLRLTFVGREATSAAGTEIMLGAGGDDPPRVASGGYDVLGSLDGATVVVLSDSVAYLPQIVSGRRAMGQAVPNHSVPAIGGSLGDRASSYEGAVELPLVGHYPLHVASTQAWDVRVRDGYAYTVVATFFQDPANRYLHVVDVRNPREPTLAGAGSGFSDRPDEVWLDGDRAYVANKSYGVEILDISNQPIPSHLGNFRWQYPQGPLVKGVHAVGDRLYVADELGIQVVDTSNPSVPRLLGAWATPFGEGIWSAGDVAYAAMNYYRVQVGDVIEARPLVRVFDVSVPNPPAMIGELMGPTAGRAVDVQVEGQVLYVAAEQGGVVTYDLADVRDPVYLGYLETHFANKIDVLDGIIYVADDSEGLVVIDASRPDDMRVIAHAGVPGRAYGVSVADGHAFLADGLEGLEVIALSALTPTATATPTPTSTLTPTLRPSSTPTPTMTPLRVALPLVTK